MLFLLVYYTLLTRRGKGERGCWGLKLAVSDEKKYA
jgi:hypothetical protein